MNSHTERIRWSVFAIAMALLVAGVGCGGGGGGGGGYAPFGTLEVSNDVFSTDIVRAIDVDEVAGPDHWSYSVNLFPGDIVDLDLFPSTFDVTVYGANGAIGSSALDVFDGFTTYLDVSY